MFDDQVVAAVSVHGADGWRSGDKPGDDGVKESDRDFSDIVFEPFVKDGAEEVSPLSGFECVGKGFPMSICFDTFDVLVVIYAQFPKIVVHGDGGALVCGGDEG